MVARAPLSMRPAGLHDGFGWCPVHAEAWHPHVRRACPKCTSLPSMPTRAGAVTPRGPKPRAGAVHELAMRAALDAAGYVSVDALTADMVMLHPRSIYVPEYTWAPHERALRADFGFPVARVLVEIEGDAHAVKRQRRNDVVRRQEAERRGWRVVSVLPEQVKSGEAVALVRAAVDSSKAAHVAAKGE